MSYNTGTNKLIYHCLALLFKSMFYHSKVLYISMNSALLYTFTCYYGLTKINDKDSNGTC